MFWDVCCVRVSINSFLFSSLPFCLRCFIWWIPMWLFYPCSIWCWEGCYWELLIFTPVIFGFLFRFISFGTGFKGPYLAMKSVAIVSVKPCFHFACLQIIWLMEGHLVLKVRWFVPYWQHSLHYSLSGGSNNKKMSHVPLNFGTLIKQTPHLLHSKLEWKSKSAFTSQ